MAKIYCGSSNSHCVQIQDHGLIATNHNSGKGEFIAALWRMTQRQFPQRSFKLVRVIAYFNIQYWCFKDFIMEKEFVTILNKQKWHLHTGVALNLSVQCCKFKLSLVSKKSSCFEVNVVFILYSKLYSNLRGINQKRKEVTKLHKVDRLTPSTTQKQIQFPFYSKGWVIFIKLPII